MTMDSKVNEDVVSPPTLTVLTVSVPMYYDDGDGIGGDGGNFSGNASANDSGEVLPFDRSVPEMAVIGIILGFVIVVTICGNLLVCVTIATNKKLQNYTNYFVMSLAATDLLLGSVVLPFSAVNTITPIWHFGAIFCNIYTANDVMLCTVSILTLFAISLDRYFAVTTPLRYQQKMKSKVVYQILACIWVFSFLMAFLPIHLGWNTPNGIVMNYEQPEYCLFELNKPYVLLISLGTYFAPLMIMCGVYMKVLRITRHQVKEINKIQKLAGGATTAMLNRACVEDGTSSDGQNGRDAINKSQKDSDHQKNGISLHGKASHLGKNSNNGKGGHHGKNGHHHHHTREKRHKEHRGVSDTKATVTLASVVLAFAICWVPYFVLFTAKPFLHVEINIHVDLFCLWLGYVNSSINPFLYAFYNSAFREGFLKVLCHRCPAYRRRQRRSSELAFRAYRVQRRGSSSDTSEMSAFRHVDAV